MKVDPPAGAAPAESLYKSDPQAAAWRRKWSQSPVLPQTQWAYETHLSAGSTAVLKIGALTQNGLPKSCESGAPNLVVRCRELQFTELAPIPKERIAEKML